MIAKLRARHRAMWGMLAVVAPAVLIAALSVRRSEESRQPLSPALESELAAVPDHDALVQRGPGLWPMDPRSGRRVVELDSVEGPALHEPDVFLYWSVEAARAGPYGWSPGEPPMPLPSDAVLIGAWVADHSHRYFVPDLLDEEAGTFVWYSLAHQTVVVLPGGRVAMSTRVDAPR